MHLSQLYDVMAFDLHNIKYDFAQTIILLMEFCLKAPRLHENNDLAKVSKNLARKRSENNLDIHTIKVIEVKRSS